MLQVDSQSQQLMLELTEALKPKQNELFNILIERHCAGGVKITELQKTYAIYPGLLSQEIAKVFADFIAVMKEYFFETLDNVGDYNPTHVDLKNPGIDDL